MTQKLQGNYNNKIEDYKGQNLNKIQQHCMRFIEAYQQDPTEEALNKTRLSKLGSGTSESKIIQEVNDLLEKGLVKYENNKELAVTDTGRQHL